MSRMGLELGLVYKCHLGEKMKVGFFGVLQNPEKKPTFLGGATGRDRMSRGSMPHEAALSEGAAEATVAAQGPRVLCSAGTRSVEAERVALHGADSENPAGPTRSATGHKGRSVTR